VILNIVSKQPHTDISHSFQPKSCLHQRKKTLTERDSGSSVTRFSFNKLKRELPHACLYCHTLLMWKCIEYRTSWGIEVLRELDAAIRMSVMQNSPTRVTYLQWIK